MIEAPEQVTSQPRQPEPQVDERIRHRIRLAAFSLLLMVLPFVTAPGNIIADTKLDLAVNPAAYLQRALTLWDPQQFGILQNQVAGYLFPMGPFFWLGKLAALPPWVVQRLWIGAVTVTAFVGVVRLAGRLGIGTPWARVAAGIAYALSPAGLAVIGGGLSEEFLPAAVLPWILLPLVGGARGGRPGIAAARSAVAVGCCGGINAAATSAVLVPVVLCILMLPRPAPRWRILAWWCPATAVATVWWSVPLLLLLRYGVSWLPYTESAAVTTTVTGLSQTLRGAEDWVSYLVVNGQPWWPLGYRLATAPLTIVCSGLVAGLGLAALARPGLAWRRFLSSVLFLGVLIIAAGHVSKLGNPLAGPVDHLINGPASPFRNVRKFDPMIRLPIALGLGHLLSAARLPRLRAAPGAVAGVAIAGLALPAFIGGVAIPGSFSQVPQYWIAAANWLSKHAHRQAVLVEPGTPFGQYTWGSPLDNVLQPLTTADWAERDVSLIGSPGNERLLSAIDQRIAAGEGSAGLAQLLARMGVRYVVVRDDVSLFALDGTWPALVNEALTSSPGITEVYHSAALVGAPGLDDAVTNFDPSYPSVVIYRVARAEPVATVQPAVSTLRVYGGPESLLTLAGEHLLGSRPVLINSDSAGLPVAGAVVSDSLRRRVRNFGELRRSFSPTLTAGQQASTFEAVGDWTEPGWNRYQSVARYQGITDVTASSSAADIGAITGQWASGLLPYAAIDGDPRTMWESGSWTGAAGQWLRLRFRHPVDPGTIRVTFAGQPAAGPPVTRVVVRTGAGQVTDRVRPTGQPQDLQVPPGETGWLQVTATGFASPPRFGSQVAIRDIAVPGVVASRLIAAPAVPLAAATVVLAKDQPWPSGCLPTYLRWVCNPSLITPTEEQYGFAHAFTAGAGGLTAMRGSAVLTSPWLSGQYLTGNRAGVWVHASSAYLPSPQDQPRAAFDGDPATTWIASPTDGKPVLTIGWRRPTTVRRLTIQRPPGWTGLLQVLITGSGGQVRGANVGLSGAVRFAPMRTSRLTIRFSPLQGPLQISGVVIPHVPQLPTPTGQVHLHCGIGPALQVNGQTVPTRAWGSYVDLLDQRPLHFAACAPVAVRAGGNQVTEPARDRYSVQDVVLGSPPPAVAAPASRVRIVSWTPSRRVLRVTASSRSYLIVNENFNAGWRAVSQGRQLQAVRLDGWKQAWLLPAGSSATVTLTYPPNTIYRAALAAGLGGLAVLMILAARPWVWARRRRSPAGRAVPPIPSALAARSAAAAPAASAAAAVPSVPGRQSVPGRPSVPGRHPASAAPARRRAGARLGHALVTAAAVTAAGGALVLAGLWLGGYPGAVLLPAAAGGFLAAGRRRNWLSSPWSAAGLMLVAAAAGAAGEYLTYGGRNGPVAGWLVDGIPQVLCLLILGRLAAALVRPAAAPRSAAAARRVRSGRRVRPPARPAPRRRARPAGRGRAASG